MSNARRITLGIVSFIAAVLAAMSLPAANWLVNLPGMIERASMLAMVIIPIQLLLLVAALGLAVAAIVRRSGRRWAVVALTICGVIIALAAITLLVPGEATGPLVT